MRKTVGRTHGEETQNKEFVWEYTEFEMCVGQFMKLMDNQNHNDKVQAIVLDLRVLNTHGI